MTELSEQSHDEWISVEDELPQERNAVLVCMHDGQFTLGNYTREPGIGQWYIHQHPASRKDYRVTHWMPLPKPPKREPPFSFETVEDGYVIYRRGMKLAPWYLVDSLNGNPIDLLKLLWGFDKDD